MRVVYRCFLSILILLALTQMTSAKEVYRCEVSGTTTYQEKPCKNKTTQKVACLNYAMNSDFKDSLEGSQCRDNGANSGGYGGWFFGYSG